MAAREELERTPTGVSGLDAVLGGGLPSNRLYLVRGGPGVGKTTLGLQFVIEGARRDETSLFITMTESEREVRENARSHGWSLDGVEILHIDNATTPEAQQTMLHSSEVALPKVTAQILSTVDRIRPKRLVIDSLTEIRTLARNDLWYRERLLIIKEHLAELDCTSLVLNNVLGSSDGPDREIQSIASGVIELGQEVPAFGDTRRWLNISKIRGSDYRTGLHDITLETGGLRLCPRLIAAEHRKRFEPGLVSSGVDALDDLLGGGLDEGTSTLLLGPSGVGKSVVATQYIVAAANRGERSALYLFDEKEQTFIERSKRMGVDIEKLVDRELLLVLQIDPGHLTPGQFGEIVRQAVDDHGVKLVVVDSLSGYHTSMHEGDQLLTLHVHELLTYLGQQAVTSLLIMAQHGLFTTQASPPVELSYLADNVLLFRYFEFRGSVHQALSVFKRRSGRHERTIRELEITSKGVHIGQPLTHFRGVLTGVPEFAGDELRRIEKP